MTLLALIRELAEALADYHTGMDTTRPFRETYERDEALLERARVVLAAEGVDLYGTIGDVAREIVARPRQRDRLEAVEFLADELLGYLEDSNLSEKERREIVARLVNELQRGWEVTT